MSIRCTFPAVPALIAVGMLLSACDAVDDLEVVNQSSQPVVLRRGAGLLGSVQPHSRPSFPHAAQYKGSGLAAITYETPKGKRLGALDDRTLPVTRAHSRTDPGGFSRWTVTIGLTAAPPVTNPAPEPVRGRGTSPARQ
jgi:hypothetical protein